MNDRRSRTPSAPGHHRSLRRTAWWCILLSAGLVATGCLLPFPVRVIGWEPRPEGGVPFKSPGKDMTVNSPCVSLAEPGLPGSRSITCFVAGGVGFEVHSPDVSQCKVTGATCPIVFEVYFEGADSLCSQRCSSVPIGTACDWSPCSGANATLEEAGGSETTQAQGHYFGGTPRFSFDRPYDPNARYRLTITGVSRHGQGVKVPPIDFEPFSQTLWDM